MTFDTTIVRIPAPLRSQVEEVLRRAISEGALAPGERVTERNLCERFGVSRPLVREALRQLEAEQLVEASPSRGLCVARPTLPDAIELYQVRASLEGLASRIAARFASPEALERLGTVLQDLETAVDADDADAVRSHKSAFYEALMDAADNQVLTQSLRRLHNRIQLFRGASLAAPGRSKAAARELRAIFEAIAAHDELRAQAMTDLHMREAAFALATALANEAGRALTQEERAAIDAMPVLGKDTA